MKLTRSRRKFLQETAGLLAIPWIAGLEPVAAADSALPMGAGPMALDIPWFPSRLHAFVWRNWFLVSPDRMARVLGATPADVIQLGLRMGLRKGRGLRQNQTRRSSLTVIRRNWHLLPYDQLLELLGWTADEMAYTLREDDFFFHKLGLLKPKVDRLLWFEPTADQRLRERELSKLIHEKFPAGLGKSGESLFSFVDSLSEPRASRKSASKSSDGDRSLRMGYSYFAVYGDPLIDVSLDPYPDGFLARLAESGVNAVWLHSVLSKRKRCLNPR